VASASPRRRIDAFDNGLFDPWRNVFNHSEKLVALLVEIGLLGYQRLRQNIYLRINGLRGQRPVHFGEARNSARKHTPIEAE
jgi:hypothetical protein